MLRCEIRFYHAAGLKAVGLAWEGFDEKYRENTDTFSKIAPEHFVKLYVKDIE